MDQAASTVMQVVVGMVVTVLLDLVVVVIQDHVIRNTGGSSVMEALAVAVTTL